MSTMESSKLGRRALIGGAVAGAAAVAVNGLVRPLEASATQGQAVIAGQDNSATGTTIITNPSSASNPPKCQANLASEFGSAVWGQTWVEGGKGVVGEASANNGTGVLASSNGHYSSIALSARGSSNAGEGFAVKAETRNGIALYGEALSPGGYGLQVVGRSVFSRSGKVTIPAGQASLTVSGHSVTPATLVVATIQGNIASRYVRGVSLNDAADTFTIRLNKAAPAGGVVVGYFIVN